MTPAVPALFRVIVPPPKPLANTVLTAMLLPPWLIASDTAVPALPLITRLPESHSPRPPRRLLTAVPVLSSVMVAPGRRKFALFVEDCVPAPLKVRLPPCTLIKVSTPAPAVRVRLLPPTFVIWTNEPVLAPLRVMLPLTPAVRLGPPMLLKLPRLIVPPKLAGPAALLIRLPSVFAAPTVVLPAPLRVSGSAPIAKPLRSRAAPALSATPPVFEPRASVFPITTLPPVMFKAPVKRLPPFRVSVSGPTLFSAPPGTLSWTLPLMIMSPKPPMLAFTAEVAAPTSTETPAGRTAVVALLL